ncbi:MAG TPA: hypothetical protein PK191_01925 [Niabella sp.]|nr:hypothetical protein [Niabella sp.]HOZ96654.1 hypothetical protein [Niabella sp.]HQW14478.1 hypothetical protein [Niabella sp.]HQX19893.1 hypothetical protein [Niabella sp.]HQX41500.1 hypothetical protein [Niabella sp.]
MKNLKQITVAAIITCLVSCSKGDLVPPPLKNYNNSSTFSSKGFEDNFFEISAAMPNLNNTTTNIQEMNGSITLPVANQLTLMIQENFAKVKDVKWKVDGSTIASGNLAPIVLEKQGVGIGVRKLNVEFTEVESGKKHNKEIKVYIFKQVYLSLQISPGSNICGEVAIGITQTLNSFGSEKIGPVYLEKSLQNICSSSQNKTAGIARLAMNIYDRNTSFSIDLIEPLKSTKTTKAGFCFLFFCIGGSTTTTTISPKQVYQTDNFSASATNQVSFGKFTSGNTSLTIESF